MVQSGKSNHNLRQWHQICKEYSIFLYLLMYRKRLIQAITLWLTNRSAMTLPKHTHRTIVRLQFLCFMEISILMFPKISKSKIQLFICYTPFFAYYNIIKACMSAVAVCVLFISLWTWANDPKTSLLQYLLRYIKHVLK